MKRSMALAVLVALGACAAQPPAEELPPETGVDGGLETRAPDTCGAAAFADLLNQPRAAAASVREPKRIVAPGDIVTTEYNPNRVNIGVNEAGIITELGCG